MAGFPKGIDGRLKVLCAHVQVVGVVGRYRKHAHSRFGELFAQLGQDPDQGEIQLARDSQAEQGSKAMLRGWGELGAAEHREFLGRAADMEEIGREQLGGHGRIRSEAMHRVAAR